MDSLIIVGAGGFGREVYAWATQCADYNKKWAIKGFLDDNPEALRSYHYSVPVLGRIGDYIPQEGECFAMGIGAIASKKRACSLLLERGANFITLVHPSAVLGHNVTLGLGSIVCPHVTLTADIQIGKFVVINCNASMGHDVVVGDWTTISGHCDITGHCQLGAEVFLGSHASIVPGRRIGDGSVIGAGSCVLQHTKPGKTVFGVPAKRIL
jgi:sugar O-acyltransferase (sialic acid O-acetyltransferase NeuD family)